MKRVTTALFCAILLLALAGCKAGEAPTPVGTPTPQVAFTPIQVLPTPTPLPPPPTPTPLPTPTPRPLPPTPTAGPTQPAAPTATSALPTPTSPPAPLVTDILVSIPAGPFLMGSDTGRGDEAPAHEVDLPAFEIDKFEVTNADFAKFVEATGYETDAEKAGVANTWRTYYTQGKDNHPVVKVSWNDAVAYCQWVGKRLPTEAEWEKAARGTDGRVYPWGSDYDPQKANGKDRGIRGTTAVGSFAEGASPYGVMDMAGNVWEWTADWYKPYPGSTFESPYFGEKFRVLRGGGWFETAEFLRTMVRNAGTPETANDDIGFRCAR